MDLTKRIKEESKPYINDSKKPDFKVFWKNKNTNETGTSTFFLYDYDAEIIGSVFKVMHPGRKILQIKKVIS